MALASHKWLVDTSAGAANKRPWLANSQLYRATFSWEPSVIDSGGDCPGY